MNHNKNKVDYSIHHDNSTSGLEAEDLNAAVAELVAKIKDIYYGFGISGSLDISSGTTTPTGNNFYEILKIHGTAVYRTAATEIFCMDTLDLSGAQAGALTVNTNGNAIARAGGLSTSTVTLSGRLAGGAGGLGVANTVGAAGTVGTNAAPSNGGQSGAGGNGGAGLLGAGGAGGGARSASGFTLVDVWGNIIFRGTGLIQGGASGCGGGSGAGSVTLAGGDGGGGGCGGGVIVIYCRVLKTDSTTAAKAITVKGGNAAAGGNGGLNAGSGGGGSGGGGGMLIIVYDERDYGDAGPVADLLDASGGDGGVAGTGATGSGVNGTNGGGGAAGSVFVMNTRDNDSDNYIGGAASGVTGGVNLVTL